MFKLVTSFLNPFIGYIKIAAIVAMLTAVSLFAWHYHSMSSDLFEAKASLVQLAAEKAAAIDLANSNAEAALKADAD